MRELTQAKFDALTTEYRQYVDGLQAAWLAKNRPRRGAVLEAMDPYERAQVTQTIAAWSAYITPLAAKWWEERGYGVMWSDDGSRPMKVYELASA